MLDVYQPTDPNYDWFAHYRSVQQRIASRPVKAEPTPPPPPPPPPRLPSEQAIEQAMRVIGSMSAAAARRILADVAAEHDISIDEMMVKRRTHNIVHARQKAMWRVRTQLHWSLSRIGRLFCCDHTTALHGVNAHHQRLLKQATQIRSDQ